MIYMIDYAKDKCAELDRAKLFRYINDDVLCDVGAALDIIQDGRSEYDVQDDTAITDRVTAADYIRRHRDAYVYTGYYDTGRLDKVLCVEVDDSGKATAALYDHPEHGMIWLDIY